MRIFPIIVIFWFLLGSDIYIHAQQKKNDPVYIQNISNEKKTVDFVIGVYPNTFHWNKDINATSMTLRILNRSEKEYVWDDFKIFLFLRDKTILYNYTTEDKDGEYVCFYSLTKEGDVHNQTLVFRKRFRLSYVKSVWVSFGDNNFVELIYSNGE